MRETHYKKVLVCPRQKRFKILCLEATASISSNKRWSVLFKYYIKKRKDIKVYWKITGLVNKPVLWITAKYSVPSQHFWIRFFSCYCWGCIEVSFREGRPMYPCQKKIWWSFLSLFPLWNLRLCFRNLSSITYLSVAGLYILSLQPCLAIIDASFSYYSCRILIHAIPICTGLLKSTTLYKLSINKTVALCGITQIYRLFGMVTSLPCSSSLGPGFYSSFPRQLWIPIPTLKYYPCLSFWCR